MKSFIAALRSLVLPYGRTSGRRIILDGDGGIIGIYDAENRLVAEVTAEGFPTQVDGGFASYSVADDPVIAAYLAGGELQFQVADEFPDLWAYLRYQRAGPATAPAELEIVSGYVGHGTSDESAVVRLVSNLSLGGRPTVYVESDTGPTCDLDVSGSVTAANILSGSAQTPAPAAPPGTTSVAVVFPTMPTVPQILLTPDSAADPTATTIRGYATNITTDGFTLNCGRETGFATNWSWLAVCDAS